MNGFHSIFYGPNSMIPIAPLTPSTCSTLPATNNVMTNTNLQHRFNRSSFTTIVDIIVGPERKIFKIHKQLLCELSPYFRTALNGHFAESCSQTLELAEEDADVFEHFQLWIYSGSILFAHETSEDISWDTLCSLYIFGDMRQILKLQNTVIDVFIDRWEILNQRSENFERPDGLLERIYRTFPGDSLLKELFVDLVTYSAELTDGDWFEDEDLYPKEFWSELAKSLHKAKVGKKAKQIDIPKMRWLYHHRFPADGSVMKDEGRKG